MGEGGMGLCSSVMTPFEMWDFPVFFMFFNCTVVLTLDIDAAVLTEGNISCWYSNSFQCSHWKLCWLLLSHFVSFGCTVKTYDRRSGKLCTQSPINLFCAPSVNPEVSRFTVNRMRFRPDLLLCDLHSIHVRLKLFFSHLKGSSNPIG